MGQVIPLMVGPAARREAVAHLQASMAMSERRAYSIVSADRKMVRYRSRRPPETELRGRLRELARECLAARKFGGRSRPVVRPGTGCPRKECVHDALRQ